jgi:hypothetical protein
MGFLALRALMIDGAADGVAVWRRVSVSVPEEGGIFLGVASACHAARFLTGEIPHENKIKKNHIGSCGPACAWPLVLALPSASSVA